MRTTAREFVATKLAEREIRVRRAGNSRYLVEPNVKEGKGGLRDLNTLFWIAKYVYRVREASDLVEAGLFTPSEYALFVRCEDFLWRVRCHMHFVTGRAEERLSFRSAAAISARLGYKSRGGLSAVERFMKHYFLIAKDVGDLTAIVCAALEEREANRAPTSIVRRSVPEAQKGTPKRRLRHRNGSRYRRAFRRVRKGPRQPDPAVLDRRSVHPADPSRRCKARHSFPAPHRQFAAQPSRSQPVFIEILTSRNAPETVLRRMNEAGVLGRFVPDFGQIVAMMQFNMYHHYTVDEHLLRAIGILANIEAHRLVEDHPLTSEILPSIGNRTSLYVALFLHDVAKGRRQDHSSAGAEVARRLSPRFGLSEAETETIVWLIQNHLVMSDTAQRRDLGDPRRSRISPIAVQTLERLKMLLILTVCDIRAVGPGVWNGWKGELLRTLIGKPKSCSPAAIRRSIASGASRRPSRTCAPACPPGPIPNSKLTHSAIIPPIGSRSICRTK